LSEGATELCIDCLSLFEICHFLLVYRQSIKEIRWQEHLNHCTPDQAESTEPKTNQVLANSERHSTHSLTTILDHEHLNDERQHCNKQEQLIVEEACEHIEVTVAQLTRINLIE